MTTRPTTSRESLFEITKAFGWNCATTPGSSFGKFAAVAGLTETSGVGLIGMFVPERAAAAESNNNNMIAIGFIAETASAATPRKETMGRKRVIGFPFCPGCGSNWRKLPYGGVVVK